MERASGEPLEDDLLQPSIGESAIAKRAPWRIASQVWVALLGGVLAVTVIASINARRLGVSRGRRAGILAAGAAGLALVAIFYLDAPIRPLESTVAATREARWTARGIAVVVWAIAAWLQKPADRRFEMFGAGRYASLWRPGLAAILILGIIQSALMLALVYLVRA